jgi:3-deoxy-alpha-D-manno-octulosonate 8-oxidase
MSVLDTGIKNVCSVPKYTIGRRSLDGLSNVLALRRKEGPGRVVYFVDNFFRDRCDVLAKLGKANNDEIIFVDVSTEPTTSGINQLRDSLTAGDLVQPIAIVGFGGGSVLDTAKAVSNLLTNGGKAEDYQGWDLVKVPGIFKIGIPTISGTGAEATRTCVMTNPLNGLKLGMNSDFTVFNHVIMDPTLTGTVPRDQFFYTGMDAYIHCMEALSGTYRNPIGDAYARETISLCREVFWNSELMSLENRERLMVASYLGGCSIATSYVGVVHPFSAALSVVLGIHHCVANCIVMRAMESFYPREYAEFWEMVGFQEIDIPIGMASNLSESQYQRLYEATVIHEKPLTNAIGPHYKTILTKEKVTEIFKDM